MKVKRYITSRIAPALTRVVGPRVDIFQPRLPKTQLALLALTALFTLSTVWRSTIGHLGANTFFDTWVYYAVQIGAVVACFLRGYLIKDRERKAWLTLAVGMSLWVAGDLYWTALFTNSDNPPAVSLADVGYMAFYPFTYVAVLMLIKARTDRTPRSVWLDGIVGGLAAASVSAAVFFQPIAAQAHGPLLTVIMNLAYPCADLLLLALVVVSFSLSGWRPDRSWLLVGASLIILAMSDTAFLFQTAKGTYEQGTLLDAGWPAAMAFLGISAWRRPKRVDANVFESWTIVVVPLMFGLIALAVITGNVERSRDLLDRPGMPGRLGLWWRCHKSFPPKTGLAPAASHHASRWRATAVVPRRGPRSSA